MAKKDIYRQAPLAEDAHGYSGVLNVLRSAFAGTDTFIRDNRTVTTTPRNLHHAQGRSLVVDPVRQSLTKTRSDLS
ncbi:hypothetical protein AN948_08305 [Rhodococcus sp. ADH]|nr:hypothetical protein AN948_08305 [Rhodococcus sp. ADH]